MQILSNQKWISKLLFLCVLLPAEIGAASPKHALGLQLGGAYVQNRDALGSPFRYGGGAGRGWARTGGGAERQGTHGWRGGEVRTRTD